MRITLSLAIAAFLASSENAGAVGAFTIMSTPNAAITSMAPSGKFAAAPSGSIFGRTCTRWTLASGNEEELSALNTCFGVNDSGTVAGSVPVDGGDGGGGHDEAVLALVGANDPQVLPLLADLDNAQARGVSADGNTAVGIAISADHLIAKAFIWSAAGGTSELPVDSGNSAANQISADGTVVAGWADEPQFGFRRAVIWQNGAPIYPKDAQGRDIGEAQAVSANGRFVVGTFYLTDDDEVAAWRWDAETGDVIPLRGMEFAGAVTDDGRIVTGDTGFLANRILMVWTEDQGAVTLSDYVGDRDIVKPTGWLILAGVLNGISRDGSIIGGCCGTNTEDFSLRSFIVSGVNDPRDRLFRADFESVLADPPVQDSGLEATTISGGANPYWEGLDTNPDAVSVDGGPPTCFYSATFGGIATHRGLWSVFFGGWLNGAAETQDFSQSVVLPADVPLFLNYWRLAAQLPDAGSLTVSVDGQAVATTDLASLPGIDVDFVPQSVDIGAYADGAAHTIRIAYNYPGGENDGFIYLDDVRIATTPEAAPAAQPSNDRPNRGLRAQLKKKSDR